MAIFLSVVLLPYAWTQINFAIHATLALIYLFSNQYNRTTRRIYNRAGNEEDSLIITILNWIS